MFGEASTTSCPSSSQSRAVASAAATQSGWAVAPVGGWVASPIRKRGGCVVTSAANGLSGVCGQYGSPAAGPAVASRIAAVSRTDRVTTWSHNKPLAASPIYGPKELRPRVGFSPTRPQQLEGTRIEPPPSLPCATATMPAATAAVEPPLEPPVVMSVFQGFRLGPKCAGSVVGSNANSGVFVLPTIMKPAFR